MATYYRWEKSNINYELNLLGKINGTGLGQFTGDTVTIYFGTGYEIAPDGSGVKLGGTVKSYDIPVSEIGDENNTLQDITGVYASRYINSTLEYQSNIESAWTSNVYLEFLGSGDNLYLRSVHGELINRYNIISSKGDFVEYVYSTSPSAYPNGGVSGNYYYDQRTTVTSPTAPTGLTYPNPITTPTVTVSWNAATSNVPDYPVDHYRVMWGVNNNPTGNNYKDVTGTSTQIDIPTDAQIIRFFVRAVDSNGQRGSNAESVAVPVYLAPTLTVPQMVMQGQSATINWSAIEGADSYTLQRKSSADADWTQVYSGANLSYTETVGTWTSLQYRVQAVFDETPGGWATSGDIQIVAASTLVISGTDGDLGILTNDVQYSISSDQTSPTIDVTVEVNGGEYASFQATSGQTYTVSVLDLPTGTGNITITATTTVSSSPVTVTRTWTYTKTAQTFPSTGSIGRLTQEGAVVWPETLAEAVRAGTPWGGNLSTALELLKKAALYNRTQVPKYNEVTVSLSGKTEGQIIQLPENGKMVEFYVAKLDYESALNGAGRTLVVRKDVYDNRAWDSGNVNAYASSDLDSWFNSTYKNMLDADIRSLIGTTKIRYTPGNGNNTVGTLERAVFALSLTELGQSHTYANTEGSALPIASTLRIAYRNGSPTTQWTRSPYTDHTGDAWRLNSDGSISFSNCINSRGSRPAFTLPSTFTATYLVDTQGTIHDQQEYTEAGDWLDVWGNAIPAVKIETGSYTGTGTSGASNPNTLQCTFKPIAVGIFAQTTEAGPARGTLGWIRGMQSGTTAWLRSTSGGVELTTNVNLSWGDNSVSWYVSGTVDDTDFQLNESGVQYNYIIIGQ